MLLFSSQAEDRYVIPTTQWQCFGKGGNQIRLGDGHDALNAYYNGKGILLLSYSESNKENKG